MDIKEIQKIALEHGFKLKEQASGNMDLNSYVYEFAQAIENKALAQARSVFGQEAVTQNDTERLDGEINLISNSFIDEHFLNNDESEQLEILIAKSMKLGELYERQKWQSLSLEKAKECVKKGFATLRTDNKYQDVIYLHLEPDNSYSNCGGRITVNIGDDFVGSYFFSHCGTETFSEFIGQSSSSYLVDKLFGTPSKVFVENGEELIASLYKNTELFNEIKALRKSNELRKSDLRRLYTEVIEKEFRDASEFYNSLSHDEKSIISKIFDDDFMYKLCDDFNKKNPVYERQMEAVQEVIDHCSAYKQATKFVKKHGWNIALVKVNEAQRLGFKSFSFWGESYSKQMLIALIGLIESYNLCNEFESLEHGDDHPLLHKLKNAQKDMEACK